MATYYVRHHGRKRGGEFSSLEEARAFCIKSLARSNPVTTPDLEITDAKLNQLGTVHWGSYMHGGSHEGWFYTYYDKDGFKEDRIRFDGHKWRN